MINTTNASMYEVTFSAERVSKLPQSGQMIHQEFQRIETRVLRALGENDQAYHRSVGYRSGLLIKAREMFVQAVAYWGSKHATVEGFDEEMRQAGVFLNKFNEA